MVASTTNNTTNAILSFLAFHHHLAWRNNTTGVFDPARKRFRTAHPSARGTADIVCCLAGGRYLEIEVKTGKDRMSDAQKAHRDDVHRAGGLYLMVRTYDDFRTQYDALMSAERQSNGTHSQQGAVDRATG